MDKKFLIIQTGFARERMLEMGMNFDVLIREAGQLSENEVTAVAVFKGEVLPEIFSNIKGIFITGSGAMVTDELLWMQKTSEWLVEARRAGIPMLGICFGHQLLAHTFGGVVSNHPKGTEVGTTLININEAGQADVLFKGLGKSFLGYVSHTQSVETLPGDAVLMASNNFEPHHCFKLTPAVYGVQFHPEFNDTITNHGRSFAKHASELRNVDDDMREKADVDEKAGAILIHNFVEICS